MTGHVATETAIALLEFGFNKLNLERIVGFADKNNAASLRVLDKAGLKRVGSITGLSKQYDYFNGECLYELDKTDWLRLQA